MTEQPQEQTPLPLPPVGAAPPPMPAPVVGYASPVAPAGPAAPGTPQKVFDTVAGPNLRVKDNLVQLACVIVGGGAGAVIGSIMGGSVGAVVGGVIGLFAALLLSGVVIGILRFVGATRK
ncbi:MAG TPA: hypothetical protein VG269_09460 [Tepidisphaeraceae bacterium]|jgi:hypothetical protein|nr:hypothetical protein [Tepidisphaeraceae bacterium]